MLQQMRRNCHLICNDIVKYLIVYGIVDIIRFRCGRRIRNRRTVRHKRCLNPEISYGRAYEPSNTNIMYVPDHLKWRILLAQELKRFYFERENAHRNCKRIFELYGRYLLGTTYDTFLNYLNQLKYEITNLRLPSYIVAAIGLLEPLRIANERLRLRKINTSWTLLEMVEETLAILQERANTPLNLRITSRNRSE